jgi:hypothetical protein
MSEARTLLQASFTIRAKLGRAAAGGASISPDALKQRGGLRRLAVRRERHRRRGGEFGCDAARFVKAYKLSDPLGAVFLGQDLIGWG